MTHEEATQMNANVFSQFAKINEVRRISAVCELVKTNYFVKPNEVISVNDTVNIWLGLGKKRRIAATAKVVSIDMERYGFQTIIYTPKVRVKIIESNEPKYNIGDVKDVGYSFMKKK